MATIISAGNTGGTGGFSADTSGGFQFQVGQPGALLAGLSIDQYGNVSNPGNLTVGGSVIGNHSVINNSAAVSDIGLLVGQTAYIDFTAATSVPLHIATADNQLYELTIMAAGNTGNGANNGLVLSPNNTTYTNFFVCEQLFQYASSVSGYAVALSGFLLARFDPRMVRSIISTKTSSKSTVSQTLDFYSTSTSIACSFTTCTWQSVASSSSAAGDTTTLWTSLGTLTFVTANTGRVWIKRLG